LKGEPPRLAQEFLPLLSPEEFGARRALGRRPSPARSAGSSRSRRRALWLLALAAARRRWDRVGCRRNEARTRSRRSGPSGGRVLVVYGKRSPAPDCRTFSALSEGVAAPAVVGGDGGRGRGGSPGPVPPLPDDLHDLPRLRPRPRVLRTGLLRRRPPRQPAPCAPSPSPQSRRPPGSPRSGARATPASARDPARGGSPFRGRGPLPHAARLQRGGPPECSDLDPSSVPCGEPPALRRLSKPTALHRARAPSRPRARAPGTAPSVEAHCASQSPSAFATEGARPPGRVLPAEDLT
jgi:hypothetical protein